MLAKRVEIYFVTAAAVLLFITGAAKILSAFSGAVALDQPDALLILPHRYIFLLLGGLELGVSAFLLIGRNLKMQLLVIAWLAANFLFYRLGLIWMNGSSFCNCLGSFNEYLPISPRTLNAAACVALGGLLVGSGAFLLIGRRGTPVEVCPEPVSPGS